MQASVAQFYELILRDGSAGTERFYDALRLRGVEPVPDPARRVSDLYAPNPVIVAGSIVQRMTADANEFCSTLLQDVSSPEALLDRVPIKVRRDYASVDIALKFIETLRRAHPLTSLDAFLVEKDEELVPSYIEWQTVGTYLTLGCRVVEAAASAWPVIREHTTLTAWPGLLLDDLSCRLRAIYTEGIEDDPRQGVVVDYLPDQQVTRREFYAIRELTGGISQGMGILDPRQIVITDGRPHYRRDGKLIPIRRVYSRLVYSDLLALESEATASELPIIHRFFQDADSVTWINHPLHFFYGSKADFPDFWQKGLSSALPQCFRITPEFIRVQINRWGENHRLHGYVQKPTDSQSGLDVTLEPAITDLRPDWILQRQIHPAACHRTLYGPRTPEVRIMCFPDETGQLKAGLIFNRVKAPQEFLTSANRIASLSIPGTGEGYGFVVY
jgi:hypothetical protein